jgi:hypothetical protein
MATKKKKISGISQNLSKSIAETRASEGDQTHLPFYGKRIGISVSNSEDYKVLGYSESHLKDFTLEVTRYLLVNGAHLIYGGDLRREGFTYPFRDMAYQYMTKNDSSQMHFTNYFGWPIYVGLSNSDEATFKRYRIQIVKVDPPAEVPRNLYGTSIKDDTIENRYYWAKSMTKMREVMIGNSDGRVLLGGRLSGYKGFYPGILEEAYVALKLKRPTYLIGAFGGAASFVVRALKGGNPKKLSEELIDLHPPLVELQKVAAKRKDAQIDLQDALEEFTRIGVRGLSRINKLSEAQNEILFETPHFHDIMFYVLGGLRKAMDKKRK